MQPPQHSPHQPPTTVLLAQTITRRGGCPHAAAQPPGGTAQPPRKLAVHRRARVTQHTQVLSPGDASTALHGVEVGHCCHGQGQGSQHGAASNQAVQEVPVEGEGEGEGGTGSRGQVAGECSCW
jgi:hypothetical protein